MTNTAMFNNLTHASWWTQTPRSGVAESQGVCGRTKHFPKEVALIYSVRGILASTSLTKVNNVLFFFSFKPFWWVTLSHKKTGYPFIVIYFIKLTFFIYVYWISCAYYDSYMPRFKNTLRIDPCTVFFHFASLFVIFVELVEW